MLKKHIQILILLLLLLNNCITQFIPQTNETQEFLVVEGLITDQPGPNTIKLSSTLPLGTRSDVKPVRGCFVTITDDLGNRFNFEETDTGTYVSDPAMFKGKIGRFYTLHINANTAINNHNYVSYPMEMKPVPPIDSVYFEKAEISGDYQWQWPETPEGCQVYLNTHDPTGQCRYYRWEYTETWEFRLPYSVPNSTCWVTRYSDKINVKSTASLAEARILKYPLDFISNLTDRLKVKYSMLVNQYSINEDEYNFWEKLQNVSEQVGGLYDMIPSAIASNVYCINNPDEKVLGYFSVSANTSKRIFIKDHFNGQANLYTDDDCIADTIWYGAYIPNLNSTVWIIIDRLIPDGYQVITYTRGCADCTTRGTTQEPLFWKNSK
ncbi:MAG: DUF4249 domain-containing protein [Bacteroidia bacterium]|nr:DUF4249 domain-containing protein [Bacteroidia bacterium]